MAVPRAEIQTLTPGSLWIGYKLDLNPIGTVSTYYFTSSLNQVGTNVVWSGVGMDLVTPVATPTSFTPMPIIVEEVARTTKGALPHAKLHVANLDGLVGALVNSLGDLVGASISRYQALTKYLDPVNFTGGVNPTADWTAGYQTDMWVIEQKESLTWDTITFDMVAACDAQGQQIPARIIQQNICTFAYKNGDGTGLCPYVGALATCDRTMKGANGCVAHFGTGVSLPIGCFPGSLAVPVN